MSDTRRRVAVATVGIPTVATVAFLGGWAWVATVALVAVGAAVELERLAAAAGARPLPVWGVLGVGAWVVVGAVTPAALGGTALVVALGALVLALRRGPEHGPLQATGLALLQTIYPGALVAAVWLRQLGPTPVAGAAWVFLPLATTWACDTAAWFVGRRWGRRRFAPQVSPGKTVEGVVAGIIGAVAGAVLYEALVLTPLGLRAPWGLVVGLGLAIGGLAPLGDLAESLLKRQAGVKDSGRLLPGHGGLLDRVDSLLFVLPVAYLLLRWGIGR